VIIARASFVRAGVTLQTGPLTVGVAQFFGDILPFSIEDTLALSARLSGDRLSIGGYYTPLNETPSRSRFGADASLRLGEGENAPTLRATWTNRDFDFGRDQFGEELVVSDDIFTVIFSARF